MPVDINNNDLKTVLVVEKNDEKWLFPQAFLKVKQIVCQYQTTGFVKQTFKRNGIHSNIIS